MCSSDLHDPEVPDSAVGYRENFVRDQMADAQLQIIEPVHPGFQKLRDAIVAVR